MRDESELTLVPNHTMSEDMYTTYVFGGSIMLAVVIFILLIAYEDGIPFGRLKKMLCKVNLHKNHKRIGFRVVKRYYCEHCKKPRNHPKLKVIDGGSKIKDNTYKN